MPYGNPMMGRNSIAQAIMAQRQMGGSPGAGMPMQQPPMRPPMQSAGGLNAQGLPGGLTPPGGGMPGMGGALPAAPPMVGAPSAPGMMPTGAPGAAPFNAMSSMFNQGQPYG